MLTTITLAFTLSFPFILFHSVHSCDTLRSSTITFSTNLLLLLAPPPSSTLSFPLRIYHHFPIFLVITCMGYPWTSLMRKHVTSDSRTNHNRDSSISLRLFGERSLATFRKRSLGHQLCRIVGVHVFGRFHFHGKLRISHIGLSSAGPSLKSDKYHCEQRNRC